MNSVSKTRSLTGRTVLISPSVTRELTTELERYGARVLTWPTLDITDLEDHAALDEAIKNLFGYDWLIFRNVNAVEFFLQRVQVLGHDIGELDALRVCAIGEATTRRLELSQIHIDVNPDRLSSESAFAAIETYVDGRDSLGGLNFLIPRAAISRDALAQMIEDAGARVDDVTAYRTCSADNADLALIKALFTGGGIHCVAFAGPSEVLEFATVFDTNDLAPLLTDVVVACLDESTARVAIAFGLRADSTPLNFATKGLAQAIAGRFA